MGSGDATAKSHDHSFEVLQKSKIGNFSVVTLRAATLKIPDLVFFCNPSKISDRDFWQSRLPRDLFDHFVETISGDELEKLLKDATVIHCRFSYAHIKDFRHL